MDVVPVPEPMPVHVPMSDYLAIADSYHDFKGSRCKRDGMETDFKGKLSHEQLKSFETEVEFKAMNYLKTKDSIFDFEVDDENIKAFPVEGLNENSDALYKYIIGDDNTKTVGFMLDATNNYFFKSLIPQVEIITAILSDPKNFLTNLFSQGKHKF